MNTSERRLAAVVFVDAVGSSRMMAEDEDGTIAMLRAHRNSTDPVVLNHGGRIVKGTGDGLLLEFPTATSALRAGLEIQELMRVRNESLPESRRMSFRVGINVSEVVEDDAGDLLGDGVNVAARIEPMAEAGGIAITDAVRQAVRGKIDVALTDAGEHQLRNIPQPVRIWKVGTIGEARRTPPERRTVATIAVLPFENMSADPEQEYFADGITEDLLTALSYDRALAVVARNSTFAYKGAATDVRTIARELDASHVIEGSVRRAGSRVRVTAQLIDAETGLHVWAERYERDFDDVFKLQDELVEAIGAKLRPSLWESAGSKHSERDMKSPDAWDLYLRGQYELNKHSIDGFLRALEFLDAARRIDGDLVAPVAATAQAWLLLAIFGWRQDGIDPWTRGIAAANEAYRLDSGDHGALIMMAAASTITGDWQKGLQCAERAIELNPYGFSGYHALGANLTVAGRPGEATEALSQAWRIGRHEPFRYDIASDLMFSHYLAGNYDAAVSWGRTAVQINGAYLQAHLGLAAAYAQLGRFDDGQDHVAAILASRPNFSVEQHRNRILYQSDEHKDQIVSGLRKAGLPG